MNSVENRKHETFRFRRYSRKSYAVFASIHREVTIGTLAIYITEGQLLKAKSAHISKGLKPHTEDSVYITDCECEESDFYATTVAMNVVSVIEAASEKVAAADNHNLKSIIKLRPWYERYVYTTVFIIIIVYEKGFNF